ncbi:transcription elongation factor S-II [Trichomonascus vanleenenianus]|uniref:transcription elongation factor DST1 n=1 Tax=Trichomonascus vanleenenianus TaxID=2268995 RepID=UPI003ECB38BA
MEVSEIKALMKALDKTTDVDKIKGILDQFNAGVKPTEKLLRETKLGIAVNKLRTHEDAEVSEKVKKVIKKWKDEVSAQKARSKASAASSAASTKSASPSSTNGNKPDSSGGETVAAKFTSHGKPRNAKNDGVRTDIYEDKARNSCVDICYTALATDSEAAPADILACAKSIEKVVFEGEKGTTATYRAKMRSLYMNLKDKHNPRLRQGVVNGDISAERLYKMSPQEMASDDLKKEIEELEKKNLFNARGATEKRAVTNRFTCGKCKQKKVSYYQMQTRSADEPLTTFCTCENCGNRWKFS